MNNTQMNGVNAEALEGLPTPQAIGPQDRTVSIRTATVEIKALTVNGRQVTQALFKQLPQLDCIDSKTLTPIGTWWGLIRYELKGEEVKGWPIVFELNGVLYRDSLKRVLPIRWYPAGYDKKLLLFQRSLCAWAMSKLIDDKEFGNSYIKTYYFPDGVALGWHNLVISAYERLWSMTKPDGFDKVVAMIVKMRYPEDKLSFLAKNGFGVDIELLDSRAKEYFDYEVLLNKYKSAYAALFIKSQALEQLFIAV